MSSPAWVRALAGTHDRLVLGRRLARLVAAIDPLIPRDARVVDLGAGSGRLAAGLAARRPDLTLRAFDVLARPAPAFPVELYDGARLPLADREADLVLLVDVLHHCPDPAAVLAEAARVAGRAVILKDHLCHGAWDDAVLRFMDWVGNRGHGIAPPYRYFSRAEWEGLFARLGLTPASEIHSLGLYPFPFDLVFERGLHLMVRLAVPGSRPESPASQAERP